MSLARVPWLLPLLLAPIAALYLWLNWYDDLGSLRGDGAIYVFTARHYAPYWPADLLAAQWAANTVFPPLYPALLAATGGAASLLAAHAVTALCLVAALGAAFAWQRSIGLPAAAAAATTALLGVAPGTWLQSFYLHPEGLYVALSCGALACLAPGQRRGTAHLWLAAGLVAAAILTRTVGVTLLPALAVALWRERPPAAWAMLAVAVAPAVAWGISHQPPYGYADTLRENYAGAPWGDIVGKVRASTTAAAAGFAENLSRAAGRAWVAAVLAALAAPVLARRLRDLAPDAWYFAAYLAVIAVWPYPEQGQRLAWVVLPLPLAYAVVAGRWLASRLATAGRRAAPLLAWAPVAAAALLVLPDTILLAARAAHPLAQQHPEYRHFPSWYEPALPMAQLQTELHLGMARALRAFAAQVPADECVLTTQTVPVQLFTGAGARLPPFEAADDATFEAQLPACRYVVLTLEPGRGFRAPYYPMQRLGGRLAIVAEHALPAGVPDGGRVIAALAVLREPR